MSPPPPPDPSPGSSPALADDAMREIFLRVPADDPKSLVRAAAVSTSWQSILSDVVFTRQYRAFHGAPPMLGFLHNIRHGRSWVKGINRRYEEYVVSDFVSTASFRPPACHKRCHWRALDSRHGLVLFHTPKGDEDFVICDLVTYDQWGIKANDECSDIIRHHQYDEGMPWNAAVLCGKDRCDHLYCHGGPFLLALVGCHKGQKGTFASVYSSVTHKWSEMVSIEEPIVVRISGQTAIVGEKVYFQGDHLGSIVEYNISEQELSVIYRPVEDKYNDLPDIDLMGVDNGMLLVGTVVWPRLCLWSMDAGPNGAKEWACRRVIELKPLFPPRTPFSMSVSGFAEGLGVIFLTTRDGLYTVELSSGQSKRIHSEQIFGNVVPYMSFYTRAWGRLPTSE
uniref:Uncharacterized protein n=1 Tax=Avena sativa TaxID=4498 RepID=A0ACD5TV44_AVESA